LDEEWVDPALSFVMKTEEFMSIRSHVAQQAFDLALPVVEELGFELVDAEYKKEGTYYFLRLFIDKRGGISIEDCELVSRAIDPVFDKSLRESPDYFEVSSPGLTRPLVTPSDYHRHEGEEVEVTFYVAVNGKKSHIGIIRKPTQEDVELESADQTLKVTYAEIASAKRTIKF
jgi:ribosome maturation factor RimP